MRIAAARERLFFVSLDFSRFFLNVSLFLSVCIQKPVKILAYSLERR